MEIFRTFQKHLDNQVDKVRNSPSIRNTVRVVTRLAPIVPLLAVSAGPTENGPNCMVAAILGLGILEAIHILTRNQ